MSSMTYEDAVAECREREGKRELSDEAALALCAGWHSPGRVGWVLAAVSSGAWSPESLVARKPHDDSDRLELFHADLYATFREYTSGSEEMLVWGMLGTWSMNGGEE